MQWGRGIGGQQCLDLDTENSEKGTRKGGGKKKKKIESYNGRREGKACWQGAQEVKTKF